MNSIVQKMPFVCGYLMWSMVTCSGSHSLAERSTIKPLIDILLKDTSICKGSDGWYLTGTGPAETGNLASGFAGSASISLWTSKDLVTWQELGVVWDLKKASSSPQSAWHLKLHLNPENPEGSMVKGYTAPEIHYLQGTYWITYSLGNSGTGLLKSTTGNAIGPYEDWGQMTSLGGGDASLFEDDDGSVYWLWGEGYIAKMTNDLKGLAEKPKNLFSVIEPLTEEQDIMIQPVPIYKSKHGPFIFKVNGTYHLTYAAKTGRLGSVVHDTFVANASKLEGPYEKPTMMVPHGGQVTVFQGQDGKLQATFYGDDPKAAMTTRPGIVPIAPDVHNHWYKPTDDTYTEKGNWQKHPIVLEGESMSDNQILAGPDGNFYFTGSMRERPGGISLLRSKDLKTWEDLGMVWKVSAIAKKGNCSQETVWGVEIHYFDQTYWIIFGISDSWGIGLGTGLLKSTTGKPEGPYTFMGNITGRGAQSIFVDDDKSVYMIAGMGEKIEKLNTARNGVEETFPIQLADGSKIGNDIGAYLTKIEELYVIFFVMWNGGYDYGYAFSKNIRGPYSQARVGVPHGGHGSVFRDSKGGYWATVFGNGQDKGRNQPNGGVLLLPLQVKKTAGDLIIQPQ